MCFVVKNKFTTKKNQKLMDLDNVVYVYLILEFLTVL